jgi:hypothetical protein
MIKIFSTNKTKVIYISLILTIILLICLIIHFQYYSTKKTVDDSQVSSVTTSTVKYTSNKELVDKVLSENKPPLYPEVISDLLQYKGENEDKAKYLLEYEEPEKRVMYELGTGYEFIVGSELELFSEGFPKDVINLYTNTLSREKVELILENLGIEQLIANSKSSSPYYLDFRNVSKDLNLNLNISYSKDFNLIVDTRKMIYMGKSDYSLDSKVVFENFKNPNLIFKDKINNISIEYYFQKGIGVVKNNDILDGNFIIFKPLSKAEVVEKDWEYFSVDFSRKALLGRPESMFGYSTHGPAYDKFGNLIEASLWFPNFKKMMEYKPIKPKNGFTTE